MSPAYFPWWKKVFVEARTLVAYLLCPLRDSITNIVIRRIVAYLGKRAGWILLYPREGTLYFAGDTWWEWFIMPEIEGGDWRFMHDELRRGDLFIDGGHHVGCYTLMAATRGAHVVAIDAASRPSRVLSKTISWNTSELGSRIQLIHGVLSSQKGDFVCFDEPPGNNCGRVASYGKPTISYTLDQLVYDVCDFDPERIFVKLDLEGHDEEALLGATQLLRDRRLRWLIIEHNGIRDRKEKQSRILTEVGFCEYTYNPETRRAIMGEHPRLKKRYWTNVNALWGRPTDAVCAECGAGCEY